jgi:hypothetical protein
MRIPTKALLAATFLASAAARAERVVVPVAIYARGANQSLWSTEIRVTNPTDAALAIHTVDYLDGAQDWLPLLQFRPGDYIIPAGQVVSFGAYDLLFPTAAQCSSELCSVEAPRPYFGAYEIDMDGGLVLETAILTGTAPSPVGSFVRQSCSAWEGGYLSGDGVGSCVGGAGPLLRASRTYYAPSTPITLTWLHTHPTRRSNVTFYNPDPVSATVTLTVSSADGLSTVSSPVTIPAHAPMQVNDIFASPPFDAIRVHNGTTSAAARATIVSTTRLYAIGWVISNQNNTVTISEPR